MRKVGIKELNVKEFSRYGTFANMINPDAEKIGEEPVEFFRDILQLDLGVGTTASFSVCRVLTRPRIVDVSEFHNQSGEGVLPLDSDVLIHVAPATLPDQEVPVDRIEIFRVPRGTFVSLRPGVWHFAPFALNSEVANVLIVLPERTYARDISVREIPEEKRVEISS